MVAVAEDVRRPVGTPRRMAGGMRLAAAALLAPATLLFVGFFVLPLCLLVLLSLLSGNPVQNPNVAFTTRHYARLVADDFYAEVLWRTVRLALYTTAASLVIGYPLAFQLARMRGSFARTLFLMAILAPMLIGIVIRTYAWMTILSDQGLINSGLRALGLIEKPVKLMYDEIGIIVALVHIYVPFMVLTLTGVIGRIDVRLEEAARSLGAGRLRCFLEVTLPLSLPGILAGSLLVFALSVSAYVTPTLIGGFQVTTLPMLIFQQISGSFNIGFAGALGVVLLAVSLLLVILYNRVLARLAGGRAA